MFENWCYVSPLFFTYLMLVPRSSINSKLAFNCLTLKRHSIYLNTHRTFKTFFFSNFFHFLTFLFPPTLNFLPYLCHWSIVHPFSTFCQHFITHFSHNCVLMVCISWLLYPSYLSFISFGFFLLACFARLCYWFCSNFFFYTLDRVWARLDVEMSNCGLAYLMWLWMACFFTCLFCISHTCNAFDNMFLLRVLSTFATPLHKLLELNVVIVS